MIAERYFKSALVVVPGISAFSEGAAAPTAAGLAMTP
jgi:hypothetical protein